MKCHTNWPELTASLVRVSMLLNPPAVSTSMYIHQVYTQHFLIVSLVFRLDGPDNGWIIKSVDDKETPNLDTFIQVMKTIPDRARVPVVYYSIADTHTILVAVVQVERHWSSFRLAVRNDNTGLWDFTDLGEALPPKPLKPSTKHFIQLDDSLGPAKNLIRCLVKVNFYMPCRLDGFPRSRKQGTGVIVDKEKGLVIVSRSIVPTSMGDLTLNVADSLVIPAKVLVSVCSRKKKPYTSNCVEPSFCIPHTISQWCNMIPSFWAKQMFSAHHSVIRRSHRVTK